MTTICVVGMKLSNNQQKVDQSVDWLKRIWIAWAIINGIGAFLAYVRPLWQAWQRYSKSVEITKERSDAIAGTNNERLD